MAQSNAACRYEEDHYALNVNLSIAVLSVVASYFTQGILTEGEGLVQLYSL